MGRERPAFRGTKKESAPGTPEELFLYGLTDRASTHGYLRGPQQDVLRNERHDCGRRRERGT